MFLYPIYYVSIFYYKLKLAYIEMSVNHRGHREYEKHPEYYEKISAVLRASSVW